MFRSISFLVVLFVLFSPVAAQEVQELTCTPEQWQPIEDDLVLEAGGITEAESQALALSRIEARIETARAECTGGQFSSDSHPNGILGPIIFSGALYEATLTVDGAYGSVSLIALEGDCGILNSITGPIDGGSETDLWEFKECVAIFEVNTSSSAPWTLSIKKLV